MPSPRSSSPCSNREAGDRGPDTTDVLPSDEVVVPGPSGDDPEANRRPAPRRRRRRSSASESSGSSGASSRSTRHSFDTVLLTAVPFLLVFLRNARHLPLGRSQAGGPPTPPTSTRAGTTSGRSHARRPPHVGRLHAPLQRSSAPDRRGRPCGQTSFFGRSCTAVGEARCRRPRSESVAVDGGPLGRRGVGGTGGGLGHCRRCRGAGDVAGGPPVAPVAPVASLPAGCTRLPCQCSPHFRGPQPVAGKPLSPSRNAVHRCSRGWVTTGCW